MADSDRAMAERIHAVVKDSAPTLGFNDAASLDDGAMWPTAFALTKLTAADEARSGELVKKAVTVA